MHPHTHTQDQHIFWTATSTSLLPLGRWRFWKVRWPFQRFDTHLTVHAFNRHGLFCNYLLHCGTYGVTLILAWWRWLFFDLQHAKHFPNISHTHTNNKGYDLIKTTNWTWATEPCKLVLAGFGASSLFKKHQIWLSITSATHHTNTNNLFNIQHKQSVLTIVLWSWTHSSHCHLLQSTQTLHMKFAVDIL